MSRIVIQDLPSLELLTDEQLAEIFGAGRKDQLRRLNFQSLEDRQMFSAVPVVQLPLAAAEVQTMQAPAPAAAAGAELGAQLQTAAPTSATLTPPAFMAKALSGSEVSLSWTQVPGATGYVVDQLVNGSWKELGTLSSSSTGTTITNLSPGTTYAFNIAAYNSLGTAWSVPQAVTTLAPPGGISFTATAASGTQINLSWGHVSGASGYVVDELVSGQWQQIGSYGSSSTGVTVNNLKQGTTYTFDVAAYNTLSTVWAHSESATTLSAPTAPTFTAKATSNTQIELSWNAVPGATSYMVDQLVNGSWQQLGTVGGNSTSVTINNLSANTTYTFQLAACNSVGTTWAAQAQSATTSATANTNTVTINNPVAATGTTYVNVPGTLFGPSGEPQFTDVHQGTAGDCWLLSSLAAVAARDPADITSMFKADGTAVEHSTTVSLYTVRFYNNAGVAQYVTVDTELPMQNGSDYYDQVANGVLWVALAEKAYVEANSDGIVQVNPQSPYAGADNYLAINGAQPSYALQAITGTHYTPVSPTTSSIEAAWNAGEPIVLGSSPNADNNLVAGYTNAAGQEETHAYAVVGINASSSNPIEMYNPWGVSPVTVNGQIESTLWGPNSTAGSEVPEVPTDGGPSGMVYGGIFWASAGLISQDYQQEYVGGAAAASVAAAGTLQSASNPVAAPHFAVDAATAAPILVASATGSTSSSSLSASNLASASAGHASLLASSAAQRQNTDVIDEVFADWIAEATRPDGGRALRV